MAHDAMPVVVAAECSADGVWIYRVLYLKGPFDFCVPIDPPACELTEGICRELLGILSVVFVCEKIYVCLWSADDRQIWGGGDFQSSRYGLIIYPC